VTGHVKY